MKREPGKNAVFWNIKFVEDFFFGSEDEGRRLICNFGTWLSK